MADASLQIGNGNWGVKTSLLLGYNVVSNRYNPIEIGVTRETLGSRTNVAGIIDYKDNNIARINYASGVGSLLLEPQRTNLLLNSVWAGGAIPTNWTQFTTGGTLTPTTSIKNPNVTAFNFSGNASRNFISQTQAFTNGYIYAISFYVQSVTTTSPLDTIIGTNAVTGTSTYLKNNVLVNGSTENIVVGNTYTLIFSATTSITGSIRIGLGTNGNSTANFTLSMPQMEIGASNTASYSTSYVPTTISATTRNQDVISRSGISDLIGQTEGVMFIESSALFNDLTSRGISISDGTLSNRLVLRYNNSSNQLYVFGTVSGVVFSNAITYNLADETQFAKMAVRYRLNDISLWVNGVNRGAITSQVLPINLSRFGFDSGDGSAPLYAKAKQVQLYKTYLTDTEMTQLTTL